MTSAFRWRLFLAAAVSINGIAFLMVRALPRTAVGIGAAADVAVTDVAVTVPLLYFLLIVRGGLQPFVSLLPVCLLSLFRATYLAPGANPARPAIAAAAELAIAALIVTRVRRGLRAAPAGDVPDQLEAAARAIVPSPRLAAILASEFAVFYFACCAWRRRPSVPQGALAFTLHRESGAAALFGVLAGVSVMEALLVHLVVVRYSLAAAWILTALSAYGCVWLVALARSFALRPILVTPKELLLRSGMMWTLSVPRSALAALEPAGAPCELRLPVAGEPNLVLRFHQPLLARGMYGITRPVTTLALALDDREAFQRALHHAV